MTRVLISGMASSNPLILVALVGGAVVALYMAVRGGRGRPQH